MTTTVISERPTNLNNQLDPLTVRKAFGQFPSGVVALTAEINGVKEALVASSFTVGVSLEPVLVSIAIQNTSRTWPRLQAAERIGVSLLAEGQDTLCRQLASKDGDRFAGLDVIQNSDEDGNGPLFLTGASLLFETSIYDSFPAGDHTMVLLEVHGIQVNEGKKPLVFYNSTFHNL